MLLEPYGDLVHHTMNRNELTLVGSETSYPLMKKLSLLNRSTKRAQRLANQHFFSIQT